jgi:pyruvate,water dikinase
MVTGTGKATEVLRDGEWVILDAGSAMVFQAPEEVWADAAAVRKKRAAAEDRSSSRKGAATPELAGLRGLIEPLNLTDAYGPTFSIHECKSLHDIIRYTHEMAVLAMFEAGDDVLEEAEVLLHRLDEGMPFHFLIIDLGGGIATGRAGFKVRLGDVVSAPLLALWKGMSTPGLRWSQPPPVPGLSGLFTRAMLDNRSARPVGNQNYALITRDYLNLNARVDFHFTMVDAVCGANPRENYIRFRFKGGGTNALQRERRAQFIAQVLDEHHFITDQQGDLVNASISETQPEEIEARLVMVGRLIGFSRLLDAAMSDDSVPRKVARAFLDGDYALQSMSEECVGS